MEKAITWTKTTVTHVRFRVCDALAQRCRAFPIAERLSLVPARHFSAVAAATRK